MLMLEEEEEEEEDSEEELHLRPQTRERAQTKRAKRNAVILLSDATQLF